VGEPGRTPHLQKQFPRQVKPMHDPFVEPSSQHAHPTVSGIASLNETLESVLSLR
jgi:hypothetical protein